MSTVEPAQLPPDTRALLELAAERLDAGVGLWRLELIFEDGRLHGLWRHEKIAAKALERFDR